MGRAAAVGCDAVSFTVMHRGRLQEALAFDGDYAAAGFVEVCGG